MGIGIGSSGIAVDASRGKIYWVYSGKIQRSNPDGTNIEYLITTEEDTPSAIALYLIPIVAPWDVNSDGIVNIFDLVLVGLQFGSRGPNLRVDVNGDGEVNVFDIISFGPHFGERTFAAAPSAGTLGVMTAPRKEMSSIQQAPAKLDTIPSSNYPNPFNPETWIPYQLASDAEVQIKIYAVNGALVRQLNLGNRAAGYYQDRLKAAYWDGRSDTGEKVSSGIYLYHLQAGDFQITRKIIVFK